MVSTYKILVSEYDLFSFLFLRNLCYIFHKCIFFCLVEFFWSDWVKRTIQKCDLSAVFSRLEILQRLKKLRMSVVSFQDQGTKVIYLRSSCHPIHVLILQMWKNASGWILLARFNEPRSGDSEQGKSEDGFVSQDISWIWSAIVRMGPWSFAHHNVDILLPCFLLSPDLRQALLRNWPLS